MKGGNKDLRLSHKSSKIMGFGILDFSNFNVVKMFFALVNNVLWG